MAKRLDNEEVQKQVELNETPEKVVRPRESAWERALPPSIGSSEDTLFISEDPLQVPARVLARAEKGGYTLRWVTITSLNNKRIYEVRRMGGVFVTRDMIAEVDPQWARTLETYVHRDPGADFRNETPETGVQIGSLVLMAVPLAARKRRLQRAVDEQKRSEEATNYKYKSIEDGVKGTNKTDVSYARLHNKPTE